MNPDDQSKTDNRYNNPLHIMSPGEIVVGEIRRHPIGLFGIYFFSALIIALLGVGAALLPSLSVGLSESARNLAYIVAVFGAIFTIIFTYIATIIYNGNRWIVTSDSVTQINQISLFTKQTSQLSLANLEDVTYEQNGILPTVFNYGILKVETAGEHSKFSFQYCPHPEQYARDIIKAHEDFITAHPEG